MSKESPVIVFELCFGSGREQESVAIDLVSGMDKNRY
jgi:hypothetical protein